MKNAVLATELPNVDFTGLNAEQKKAALKRMNSETCDCGCTLTLAQCRINDTSCPVSKKIAAQVVKEIAANGPRLPDPVCCRPACQRATELTPNNFRWSCAAALRWRGSTWDLFPALRPMA